MSFLQLILTVISRLRGLVSGATIRMPCSAAARCAPALVIKFCSVHVKPVIRSKKDHSSQKEKKNYFKISEKNVITLNVSQDT